MKLKKTLFITILVISMTALVGCGGEENMNEWDDPTIPEESENFSDNTEAIPEFDDNNEADIAENQQPDGVDDEVILTDGAYTGGAVTLDGSGEISAELTIEDGKIKDFQLLDQSGIEIEQSAVENFRVELLEKQAVEEIVFEELSAEQYEIDLLMQASIDALVQAVAF